MLLFSVCYLDPGVTSHSLEILSYRDVTTTSVVVAPHMSCLASHLGLEGHPLSVLPLSHGAFSGLSTMGPSAWAAQL